MSWSDRRRALAGLAVLGAVAACGFRPAYGPGGAGAALDGRVRPDDPTDRDGFLFVEALEDRLGVASEPRYRLRHALRITSEGLGVDASASTTRYHLVGRVEYALIDSLSGATIDSGTVEAFTAYSTTSRALANAAAARDARRRLVTILADRLVARLLAARLPS